MRFRFLLGLAAVAAIAAGSVLGALVVRSHEDHAFERRQRDEALRSAHQAEALAALSVGQLASAAAFYQVEGTFTQHEFRVMAGSLLDAGALSGTGLVVAVPASRRAQFERAHGYPIVERTSIGFRRAPSRPVYYPLTFAASDSGLEPPLGYDLGADPARSSSLLRARDSGKPAATRVMHLPIGGTGINVFRPVYRDGAPTATVAQRRAALTGFAVGAFHVPDLTAAATSALPNDVAVQLVEGGRSVAGPQLPRGEAAATPLRIADRSWLLVVRDPNGPDVSLPLLIAVFGISMAALLGALVLIWSRNERMQELTLQAGQDPLTGLKNRRRFEEDVRTEIARSRRDGSEGALLMLDLDNFKQVNDTLGHPVGDRVIAGIGGVLRARMRQTDVVARLGGDEFAIVLPRCSVAEARSVGTEIATAIREHAPNEEAVPPITVSVGIAMFGSDAGSDLEALEEEADAALYEAKRAGRDALRVAGESAAPVGGSGDRA
ncbi:MAG TPA: diguanylate cyclase [Solirubrobacterales bacterium]|nr:diguanylate cyclase [Solirubrobacterales bacterium]